MLGGWIRWGVGRWAAQGATHDRRLQGVGQAVRLGQRKAETLATSSTQVCTLRRRVGDA